jgi:hypothetical protein
MKTKVLVVKDDHSQRAALSEILSVIPRSAIPGKALLCEVSHFLPNPFRWQVLTRVVGRFYGTTRPRPEIYLPLALGESMAHQQADLRVPVLPERLRWYSPPDLSGLRAFNCTPTSPSGRDPPVFV